MDDYEGYFAAPYRGLHVYDLSPGEGCGSFLRDPSNPLCLWMHGTKGEGTGAGPHGSPSVGDGYGVVLECGWHDGNGNSLLSVLRMRYR